VRRYLAGTSPIGLEIGVSGAPMTIVGVVKDSKIHLINEPAAPFLYDAHRQRRTSLATFVVRSVADPRLLVEPIRRVFAEVNPNLPALDPRTMRANMAGSFFVQSIGAKLLGALGAVALVLAAIGVYGVLSYAVSRRTREIGIRVALGATREQVVGMVAGQTGRLTAAGVGLGSVIGLGAGRLLEGQLFGVRPADPVTFFAIAGLLVAVAALAGVVPARRATRVDPIRALKAE